MYVDINVNIFTNQCVQKAYIYVNTWNSTTLYINSVSPQVWRHKNCLCEFVITAKTCQFAKACTF